ncbi:MULTISPECIES: ABC transporter permease subunit [Clostridium]|uniref:ABC transporter permease subunit n=1 Tax=Clostridium TaxID=1485 RepID=UPI000826A2E7|nr:MULTISPECIES: ABC transporter permease subunit [Clostridium]PJI08247.1 ABC transporter permease [Clostridium sp. CT7]
MWGLISNELYKIIKRKKFWITFIVFLAIFMAYSVLQYSNSKKYSEPKQRIAMYKAGIKSYKSELKSASVKADQRKKIKQSIKEDEKNIKDLQKQESEKDLNWQMRLNKDLRDKKHALMKAKGKGKNEDIEKANMDVMTAQYYVDNNINIYNKAGDNALEGFLDSKAFVQIIVLFIIIAVVTSDIVSFEYSSVTIKMLLAKPASRFKILLSKFIAILGANVFLVMVPQIITYFVLSFMDGFPNLSEVMTVGTLYQYDPSVVLSNGETGISPVLGSSYIISTGKYLIYMAGLDLLFILGCVSICFLISTLIKNSAVTIGVSVGIGLVMSIIGIMTLSGAIPKALSKITPYLIMTYSSTDLILSGLMAKRANNPMITVSMGIGVFIVYTVVCFGISAFVFSKRDVLA